MKHYILSSLFFLYCLMANAQVKVIGTVYSDTDKETLIGAAVLNKETGNGTVTDINGKFSINCKSLPATLEISYLGMNTQIVAIKNQKELPLKVYLKETQNEIEEIVVIGYGTIRKSDLTGSVSGMKGNDIGNTHMLSLDQAMAGKMAGVNVTNTSGEPGAGINIQIRGIGSINTDCTPLYVIDGAPMYKNDGSGLGSVSMSSASFNPLSYINPNDIQSIEILKDASATAIYGSRGANGVVMITTKSGIEGKPIVTFNASVGVGSVSKKIEMLQGENFLNYMAQIDNNYAENYNEYIKGEFYDWQDELFKHSISQDYSVSVRGGTKDTKYAMSVAYTDQSGLVDRSGFNRITFRSKVDQNIGKRAKVGINMSLAKTEQDGIPSAGGKESGSDVFQQILSYRPANAHFNGKDENTGDYDYSVDKQTNPSDYINSVINRLNTTRTNINAYAQYEILADLQFKTSYNMDVVNTNKEIYYGRNIAAGYQEKGVGINSFAKRFNWSWENILTYNTDINKEHNINTMVGYTMERNTLRNLTIRTKNFPEIYDGLTGVNVGLGQEVDKPNAEDSKASIVSYLARVNYSYKSKYLLTTSIRADGSSKFAKGNKFAYFPSAAIAWNMHHEAFMNSIKRTISEFKLRFSWGRTGNQAIGNYKTLTMYSNNNYYTFNETGGKNPPVVQRPGISISGIANPNLQWETTEQYNIGFDLALFKHKISLSVDAYYKKTFDMLMDKKLDYSTGFDSMTDNCGSLRNQGIEFVLNTINIQKRDFQWNSSLNMTFNRSKVLDLGDNDQLQFGNFMVRPNMPLGTMYGYKYEGVYQYKDYKNFYIDQDPSKGMLPINKCEEIYNRAKIKQETLILMDGVPTYNNTVPMPGSAKFANTTGDDNNVNADDKTYIGHSEPKFYGGFVNKLNYKGFDLNIFMQFSYGNELYVTNYQSLCGFNDRNLLQRIYDNAWQPNRDSNLWPDYTLSDSYRTESSSLFVEDASYLKIKDITLGYTLPVTWLKKAHISRARIFISGQNLYTFTKFNWYDPEVASNNAMTAGTYKFVYPSSRTLLTGITIDF